MEDLELHVVNHNPNCGIQEKINLIKCSLNSNLFRTEREREKCYAILWFWPLYRVRVMCVSIWSITVSDSSEA